MQKPLVHCPPAVQGLPFAFGWLTQVPAPSHERPWSGLVVETHIGAPVGSSLPAGTNAQVPRLVARLQILHVSLQSVLQQTPSVQ